VYFTVSDLGGSPIKDTLLSREENLLSSPATPSSGRSLGGFTTSRNLGGTPTKLKALLPATLSNRSSLITRSALRQGEDMSLLKGEGNRSQMGGLTTSKSKNLLYNKNLDSSGRAPGSAIATSSDLSQVDSMGSARLTVFRESDCHYTY